MPMNDTRHIHAFHSLTNTTVFARRGVKYFRFTGEHPKNSAMDMELSSSCSVMAILVTQNIDDT